MVLYPKGYGAGHMTTTRHRQRETARCARSDGAKIHVSVPWKFTTPHRVILHGASYLRGAPDVANFYQRNQQIGIYILSHLGLGTFL